MSVGTAVAQHLSQTTGDNNTGIVAKLNSNLHWVGFSINLVISNHQTAHKLIQNSSNSYFNSNLTSNFNSARVPYWLE